MMACFLFNNKKKKGRAVPTKTQKKTKTHWTAYEIIFRVQRNKNIKSYRTLYLSSFSFEKNNISHISTPPPARTEKKRKTLRAFVCVATKREKTIKKRTLCLSEK
eukprot:GEMP01050773.1.p1 GENE.GEMP01050773.1~~GEMP01050773.1.p1  ORF type:complete len:105 (+),score=6.75 GEMP01050773.1:289-603(+)